MIMIWHALSLDVTKDLTFWNAKSRHDSFDQTQNVESTAAHIGKEKHYPDAAPKLWTQGSADHVW